MAYKDPEKLREYHRKYYAEHRNKRLEQQKKYHKTEKCKVARRKRDKKYNVRNPEKPKAQNALNHAVTFGKIIRPNECFACGEGCTPDGHHWDYTRPLDVRWLCRTCHKKLHAWCKEFKKFYLSL